MPIFARLKRMSAERAKEPVTTTEEVNRDRSPPRRSRSRSRSRSPRRRRSRSRSRSGDRKSGGSGSSKLLTGRAARWNERGFGFIKPDNDDEDIFCHCSAIQDGNSLREGDPIEYEKVYDQRKGKYRAENVTGGRTEDRRTPSFGGGGGGGGGGECYAFRDGNCTRGSSCRFSHGGGGGGGDRGGYGGGRGGYGGGDRGGYGGGDRGGYGGGGGRGYDDRRSDRY